MKKRAPGWLRYIGDELLPSFYRDYFISHEKRIPSLPNQDFMESNKVFFRGSHVFFLTDGEISLRTEQQKWSLPPESFSQRVYPLKHFFFVFSPPNLGEDVPM